jgi:hypothetical protein
MSDEDGVALVSMAHPVPRWWVRLYWRSVGFWRALWLRSGLVEIELDRSKVQAGGLRIRRKPE